MKLWILKPIAKCHGPWSPIYDCAHGFVVRAEDEASARRLIDYGDTGDEYPRRWRDGEPKPGNPWHDPSLSTCVELVGDGEAGVILRDFNAS